MLETVELLYIKLASLIADYAALFHTTSSDLLICTSTSTDVTVHE